MSQLLAAGRPENLRTPGHLGVLIENDVFDICKRLKEIDKDLLLIFIEEGYGQPNWQWNIFHVDTFGQQYWVWGYEAADARMLEHIRWMLSVPFEQRYKEAEAKEAKAAAERKQYQQDKMFAEMGEPMQRMLYRTGFADSPHSYRKINKQAQRYRSQNRRAA